MSLTLEIHNVPLVAPEIGDGEIEAVVRVLRSGQIAEGPEVAAFEREIAYQCGVTFAVAMNSGTAALHAGLAALGVGPGDEVLTTPFTFAATATPVLMLGARPRFVNVNPQTYNLEPSAVAAAVTPNTKAAVVVNLFGLPANPATYATLRERGVRVFEDACQAIGASRDGKPAGSFGDAASLSFYATKNLTTGEGGMLLTEDADIASAARRFRHHGQSGRYRYETLGYNYRMTDVAAAIGRVQLERLDDLHGARCANAAFYDRELTDTPGLTLPYLPPDAVHAFHQYSVLIDAEAAPSGRSRDDVRGFLAQNGVGSGVYYPSPLHLEPLFSNLGYARGDFPVAEDLARRVLSLPVHPRLTSWQRTHVARTLRRAMGVER